MRLFRRGEDPYAFAATMIGVKMGDRLLQVGCGDGALLAALGGKVGLTGRACGVDPSAEAVARAERTAAKEGVLLELQQTPPDSLPFEPSTFDVVVLHAVLADVAADARPRIVSEALRTVRSGGRVIVADPAPRGGLAGLVKPQKTSAAYDAEALLRQSGCRAVRTLTEREGWRFVEGVITRGAPSSSA
jgi:ubiquinone/menaquinone biosynthesis C-methylase UbiE